MEISFQDGANFIHNLATVRWPGGRCYNTGDLRRMAVSQEMPRSIANLLIDLSIDDEDFADTVQRLAWAACDMLEVRTAQVLRISDYHLTLSDWWLGRIEVRRAPLREFVALEYLASRDNWVAVDPADYWVVPTRDSFTVMLLDTFSRPTLWQLNDCIRMRFQCGFNSTETTGTDDDPALDAPDHLLTTWTLLTAHFYEHRELFTADKVAGQVAASAGSLLDSVRTYW